MAKRQSMTERVLQELRNDIINWNYDEKMCIRDRRNGSREEPLDWFHDMGRI